MDLFKRLNLTRFAALFVAVSVVAACDDDGATGPAGTLDPVQTATTIENVANQFFVNNAGVQSLSALNDEIFAALGSPTIAAYASIPNPEGIGAPNPELREQVETLRRATAEGVELQIPAGLLGNTLVFDEELGRYAIDQARTGAPTNGVRFILYAINQATGRPLSPPSENEIGHVDIIDNSDFPTVSISLTVVAEGQTLVDVTATGTGDELAGTFNLDFTGTLSDGTNDLTFNIDVDASETAFDVGFSMAAAGLQISVTFSGTPDSDAGDFTLEIFETSSQDRLVFDIAADAQDNLSGGISLNGAQLAVISGTFDVPVITNGDGDPLTDAELAALEDLFEAMAFIFEVFGGLVEMALFLLFLGLV